jgi:hypothetical protein
MTVHTSNLVLRLIQSILNEWEASLGLSNEREREKAIREGGSEGGIKEGKGGRVRGKKEEGRGTEGRKGREGIQLPAS